MPKVSVIMPTYNKASYITESIDSALSQTFRDYEIIVIDDGSRDGTRELLKRYSGKIRYTYQENQGIAAARNLGISQSKAEYIAFLDADDIWLSDKLERQVLALEKDPNLAFVCSEAYIINKTGEMINWWKKPKRRSETFESLYDENFVLTLTVLLRRKCFDAIGGFDTQLHISDDYDLWLRLAKKYKFAYLNYPTAKYRKYGDNASNKHDVRLRDHLTIVQKPEISGTMSAFKKRVRVAKAYYYFAGVFQKANDFSKASATYLRSLITCPFIGVYYWPKKAKRFRSSLPYRVLRVYVISALCFLKGLKQYFQFKSLKGQNA